MFSVSVTIADINLETGSVPKYVNMFKFRDMFQNGFNFKKRLKPWHYSLVSNKIMNIFIFFASLRIVLCESAIYTRDIFRDIRIVKN